LSLKQLLQRAKIRWSGVALDCPDWSEHSHALAITLESLRARFLMHGMFNSYWEPLTFELPPAPSRGRGWQRCIDTALASPDDIRSLNQAPTVSGNSYIVQPRSVVLLVQALQPAPAI
jgi:glycogen operon protein